MSTRYLFGFLNLILYAIRKDFDDGLTHMSGILHIVCRLGLKIARSSEGWSQSSSEKGTDIAPHRKSRM